MLIEFVLGAMGGVLIGVIATLAIRDWLDIRRANEIRDNTIQMSKMEQRIMMSVKHLMQKSKEEK
jgi:hypothetical protein